jgi:pantetheine-phosphate adenylyltransferase
MIRAIYPGSFDPVTLGHMDIIERASKTVDELIVAVLKNGGKNPLFTTEERVEMLKGVTAHIPNVKVMSFSGLLVDFAKQTESGLIVRGLRAISDFEYELQMAQTNRKLNPDVDTMFLTTSLEYAYLSSTTVKEVAFFEGNISEFIPQPVVPLVQAKVKERKSKG